MNSPDIRPEMQAAAAHEKSAVANVSPEKDVFALTAQLLQRDRIQKEHDNQDHARQDQLRQENLKQDSMRQDQLRQAQLKQEQMRREQIVREKQIKEANKTPEQLAKDEEARAFSARSEMSLASIAFCSPLMLFGMGTAMSVFDSFSGNKKDVVMLNGRPVKKGEQQERPELSQYAREEADKRLKEMMARNELLTRQTEGKSLKPSEIKRSEKTEKAEKPRVNRFIEAEAPRPVRASDSLEIKKLWKERQKLVEHLERVRGQGSLALVSKLVSRLETLDRSLKRLGCDPEA